MIKEFLHELRSLTAERKDENPTPWLIYAGPITPSG